VSRRAASRTARRPAERFKWRRYRSPPAAWVPEPR
jgi:hypothetical protein